MWTHTSGSVLLPTTRRTTSARVASWLHSRHACGPETPPLSPDQGQAVPPSGGRSCALPPAGKPSTVRRDGAPGRAGSVALGRPPPTRQVGAGLALAAGEAERTRDCAMETANRKVGSVGFTSQLSELCLIPAVPLFQTQAASTRRQRAHLWRPQGHAGQGAAHAWGPRPAPPPAPRRDGHALPAPVCVHGEMWPVCPVPPACSPTAARLLETRAQIPDKTRLTHSRWG